MLCPEYDVAIGWFYKRAMGIAVPHQLSTMNQQPFSPCHPRMDGLHRGAVALSHTALVILYVTGRLTASAENGKLLDRTEFILPDTVFKTGQPGSSFSNLVQRVRFWRFTYESDGLKVCGYMAAPRRSGPLPCIIENRGGNRDFGAWTDTNALRLASLADASYFMIASNYRGSPGSEGRDEFGGADVNDVLNLLPLIDSLKEEIDSTRIGMLG
jgi:dipeptidyl aminopeptidase/acylaminoacyl peptidase